MILPSLLAFALTIPPQGNSVPQEVAKILDDWHQAASVADGPRYFGHLAEDAVFLGSDATERWDRVAFERFAHPHFAKGKGWTFRSTQRSIAFAAKGNVAWFDELLASEHMGVCRGSGLLEKRKGTWKILQYNLSVPIPNGLLKEFKARIESDGKTQ